ncbi:ATG2A protein, partial [Polypterus senegalus]
MRLSNCRSVIFDLGMVQAVAGRRLEGGISLIAQCSVPQAAPSGKRFHCLPTTHGCPILSRWAAGNAASGDPVVAEQTPLKVLRFYNQGTFPFGTAAKPCAQIHYKYAQRKTRKVGLKKPSVKLESEIFIELSEFCLEFDLGVLDRLNTLILLFTKADKGDGVPPPNFPENLPSGPNSELTTVHIVSPRGELKLQFPVPDLRPEPKRRPSWHKEVRKEVLLLEFSELDFRTDINGSGPLRLEIIFSDLHGKYGDASQIVHPCIRVHKMCDPQWKGTGKKILIPKIVVTVNPAPVFPDWEGLMEKSTDMDMGTVESPCELRQRESSPFSSKRTMFETEEGENGKKLDNHHGELVLDVEGGTIFTVSQYKGDPNLSYFCIEGQRVELYHKDSNIKVLINIHLDANTILRLQGATMRHHMAQNYQSWNEQLVDFLNVMDDPILGYTPPAVITVLHSHLLNCAVDYRPLYLPVRILITAETFTLSSNIIVDTATFHLRFILDDSALYLSEKCDAEAVELRKDYVCVLDVDLLELGITTWKGSATGKLSQPLFELRCSNNVVHLHTCADSCAMLVNLLQYIVNSGDLHPPPRQDSPTEIAGQKLQMSESPASLPACLPAETAEINQYDLTDALLDTEKNQREDTLEAGSPVLLRQGSPVSVYLFPGENQRVSHPTDNTSGASEMGQELVADPYPSLGSEANSDTDNSTDNDDFCILEAPGIGIPPKDGEPLVSQLVPGPISIRDGHFSRPLGSSDLLKAPSRFPVPETRIMLREISVVWHLYGGRDFGGKPTPTHSTVHSPRVKSGGHTPARSSPSRSAAPPRPQNSWRVQGGGGRSHSMLMEIQLSKVSFQHESYPSSSNPPASGEMNELEEQPLARQVFIVQELEVRDRLASSQINKFLYLYTSEKMPRRAHSNMLTIKALHIRPESGLGGPECCLRVSLMPLRLNIDQDALFFLKDYFTGLAAGINPFLPVETAAEGEDDDVNDQMLKGKSTKLNQLLEETPNRTAWGTFAGILIGLAQLNCSELKLKRLCCRHGLLGVDKVINYAVNEWVTDIRKNQLPGILGGVGPMHSVVQLFHGLRDLFWLPIEQYRKDGRIIRGLQRGAASFGTSTASAALELSNRLVQAIQATAETVYDILSPTPPISRAIMDKRYVKRQRRAQQPADLREGVVKAYDTVREGVIDTAQTICDVATRGHEQKGLPGAVGGVLRQIPPTVVRPLIVATEATSNLLGGMRNQIKPDARKEDFLKWRTEESQD